MNTTKEDLQKWISKWEEAQKTDLFKSPNAVEPTPETGWDDVLSGDLIQEKLDHKSVGQAIMDSPNPIQPTSVGVDQDIKNPNSMSATYSVGDLERLEGLKLKLHGLLDKLNTMEGLGKSATKLESQITSLNKQIDDLSDSLSKIF